MPNGFGFGGGRGGGMGFGFRGSSPPWPYVGLGRGGLPRCWYPGLYGPQAYGQAGMAPFYSGAWSMPAYGGAATPGAMPFAPQMTRELELDFLKNQAQAIKGQLEQIEARMRDLGTKEG